MKVFLKILAVAAAIAGVVAVIVIFGDKIVAWCKKFFPTCECECECDGECECAETEEAVAEDFASVEEAPAEEVVVEETDAVAEEVDFEG